MRIKVSLFVVALLCVLISGCKAEDRDNIFEIPLTPSIENNLEEQQPTGSISSEIITQGEPGYQYGNMQRNVPPGDFMYHDGCVIFSEVCDGRRVLLSYDLDSGIVNLMCTDATCTHNTSQCPAAAVQANLEQYGGKLYGCSSGNGLLRLSDGQWDTVIGGGISTFWHAGEKMYIRTQDGALLVYDSEGGKSQTILEEYTSMWNVVFGQYLYGQYMGLTRVDLQADDPKVEMLLKNVTGILDETHFYYVEDADIEAGLYRCDLDGSNRELIFDQPVVPGCMNFDNEYLYFRLYIDCKLDGENSHDLYRLCKSDPTQVEKIATLDECVYQTFTVPGHDILFVTTYDPDRDTSQPRTIYVMQRDGSNMTKLEYPDI